MGWELRTRSDNEAAQNVRGSDLSHSSLLSSRLLSHFHLSSLTSPPSSLDTSWSTNWALQHFL